MLVLELTCSKQSNEQIRQSSLVAFRLIDQFCLLNSCVIPILLDL
jgi:hypothetical protein